MEVVLFGASHASAPGRLLRRIVVPPSRLEGVRCAFLGEPAVAECVVLSTCNRLEVYAVGRRAAEVLAAVRGRTQRLFCLSDAELACFYGKEGPEAAGHLLRVAAGLDSMAAGEAEVLGQVRDAYLDAARAGAAGPVTHRLFQRAVACARRIRARSGLTGVAPSLAAMAVREASRELGGLDGARVLVLGAGHTGRDVARRAAAAGARVTLVGRTRSGVESVARPLGAAGALLADLPALLPGADLLVCCTSAPHPVVDEGLLAGALRGRRRPLLLFDLAVPPDVPEGCERLRGLRLVRLEGLAGACEAAREAAEGALAEAEAAVLEELPGLVAAMQAHETGRLLGSLVRRYREMAEEEARRLIGRLGLGDAAAREVSRSMRRLAARLAKAPSSALEKEAASEDFEVLLSAARRIFGDGEPE